MGRKAGIGRVAIAIALAVVVAAAPSAAPARSLRTPEWVVSGSITGSYSNSVTWVQCLDTGETGTAHESLTLNAKIKAGTPVPLGPRGIAFTMKMVPGGSWSVHGSYPPRISHPDDTVTCGAQQSINCGGKVRRNGPAAATLFVHGNGRMWSAAFLGKPSFSEDAAAGPCLVNTEALLGLEEGLMEEDVFRENALKHQELKIPRARFARGRPFTITTTAGPDGGCHAFHYSHCAESGGLKMTLHFAPR